MIKKYNTYIELLIYAIHSCLINYKYIYCFLGYVKWFHIEPIGVFSARILPNPTSKVRILNILLSFFCVKKLRFPNSIVFEV